MKHVVIGTAGHIDHGKSSLVRALTGTDPDRLKEEKARGITIDLGFAHLVEDDIHIAFVDVPGHERFVKNMLAGVAGIDAVVLVIAADESVMPQTREHFDICRLLRVPAGLIVLTKCDLVDADTLELVRLEARELVQGTFLERAAIVSVSSETGEGLDDLKGALADIGRSVQGRSSTGAARLPIDRVFSMRGFGTVVTGTLVSGRVAAEDELAVLPADRRVKVRGVQVHGAKQALAQAGQRVAVNLGGVDVHDLGRGDSLVTPGSFEPSRVVDVLVEVLPATSAIRHGRRVRFHQGTVERLGRLSLAGVIDAGGRLERAGEIPPGRSAYARLRLEAPAVVTRGDRYILRAYSPAITIAGGVVLDPLPPRLGIRTPAGQARFAALGAIDDLGTPRDRERAVRYLVVESGLSGLPIAAMAPRAGVPPADVAGCAAALVATGGALMAGDRLVGPDVVRGLEERVLEQLGKYHAAQPLSEGMPREEMRERVFGRAGGGIFELVIERLAGQQRITARDRLARAGHRLALTPDEEKAQRAIEHMFRSAGLKPPEPGSIATTVGVRPDVADRMVALLVRQRVVVQVGALLFHEEALRRLKEEVVGMKSTGGGPHQIDVGSFKERYGITRKFAIPLLEYLDRERVTRRVGDARLIV
jgi:selenocysteine-specific elongation factor